MDSIDLDSLMKLKGLFEKDGELEEDEFVDAFSNILGSTLSRKELTQLFMKVDANSDGGVDWNEFTNYMFSSNMTNTSSEFSKHSVLEDEPYITLRENLFSVESNNPPDVISDAETVVSISFSRSLGYIITANEQGIVKLWHPRTLVLQETIKVYKSFQDTSGFGVPYSQKSRSKERTRKKDNFKTYGPRLGSNYKPKSLVTAVVHMTHSNRLAVASSGNGVVFIELQTDSRIISNTIEPTSLAYSVPVCIDYYFDQNRLQEIFVIGTDAGTLHLYLFFDKFWQISERKIHLGEKYVFKLHRDYITQVHYVNELSSVVSCSMDTTVNVFDIDRKKTKRIFNQHNSAVYTCCWCGTVKLLASAGLEKTIILWSPYSKSSVATLTGHTGTITGLISNNNHFELLSFGIENLVRVWDLRSHKCLQILNINFCRLNSTRMNVSNSDANGCNQSNRSPFVLVQIEKEEPYIASYLQQLRLYPRKPKIAGVSRSHNFPIVAALYNPYFSQVVSLCESGSLKIWDFPSGNLISNFSLVSDAEKLQKVSLGHLRHTVPEKMSVQKVVEADSTLCEKITYVDALSQAIKQTLSQEREELDYSRCFTAMCFDNCGRRIITGSNNGENLKVWNFSNGSLIKTLIKKQKYSCGDKSTGQRRSSSVAIVKKNSAKNQINYLSTSEVCCVIFAVLGQSGIHSKLIIGAGWDRKIYVWKDETEDGPNSGKVKYHSCLPKPEEKFLDSKSHLDDISSLCFIPPNSVASAGASGDGKILVWNLFSSQLSQKFTFDEGIASLHYVTLENEKNEISVLLAVMDSGILEVLHVPTATRIESLSLTNGKLTKIVICSHTLSKLLLSADGLGVVRCWGLRNSYVHELQDLAFLFPYSAFSIGKGLIVCISYIDRPLNDESCCLLGFASGDVSIVTLVGEPIITFGGPKTKVRKALPKVKIQPVISVLGKGDRKANISSIIEYSIRKKRVNYEASIAPGTVWYRLNNEEISAVLTIIKVDSKILALDGFLRNSNIDHGLQQVALKYDDFKNGVEDDIWNVENRMTKLVGYVFTEENQVFKVKAACFFQNSPGSRWGIIDCQDTIREIPTIKNAKPLVSSVSLYSESCENEFVGLYTEPIIYRHGSGKAEENANPDKANGIANDVESINREGKLAKSPSTSRGKAVTKLKHIEPVETSRSEPGSHGRLMSDASYRNFAHKFFRKQSISKDPELHIGLDRVRRKVQYLDESAAHSARSLN
eukprot:augustus_masked-scaffold_5-processed-gene-18.3-mRNA-1 protein AED:0.11 eAED:0.12 QI:0/-1/0/1/-1/1/1/0/1234